MGTPGQFLEQAALSGYKEAHARKEQRKDMLTDEDRQQKASDLIDTRNAILTKLPTLLGANGEKTPEYDQAYQSLTQTQQDLGQLYHPDKAPGALQQDWHWLLGKMHGIVTPKTPATAPGASPAAPAMGNVPKGATPTMAVAKPKGLVEPGNIPIWNRPSVLNDDGTHSSELSISMQDDKGNEVLIPLIVDGKFLTPNGKMPPGPIPHNAAEWDKASPEWKALKMRAWQHYEKTGQHLGKFGGDNAQDDVDAYAQVLHSRGNPSANAATPAATATAAKTPPAPAAKPVSWGQAQLLKKQAASLQKAQHDVSLLVAGGPLSQQVAAQLSAQAQEAGKWAALDADMSAWDKRNPGASKEDRDAIYSQLYEQHIGTTGKGNWEVISGTVLSNPDDPNSKRVPVSYSRNKIDNQLTSFDRTPINPEVARTFTPDPKATGTAAQDLKDYNNDPDPNKGSFASWKAKQTVASKGLVWDTATGQVKGGPDGRRYNSWDKDLPPDVRDIFASQARMLDDKQRKALALAAARGASYANARMIDVQDPKNPGYNIVVPAGLAYRLGYKTPNGAYYSAMQGMLKDATYGQIGNEFVAFGTALQHADQLQKAAVALNNGDSRTLNSLANGLSVAFGDPSVTNFDVVSQVYTGEITKAINAGHITQSELEENHALIPANASHAQILGAIQNFKTLLNSKINNRLPQIQSILGQFGMQTPFTPPGYIPPSNGSSKDAGKFPVTLPNGKKKYFPTQQAADKFKAAAGIK